MMTPIRTRYLLVAGAALACIAPQAQADLIDLTDSVQPSGNHGESFRPVDELGESVNFSVSARTAIRGGEALAADAPAEPGTLRVHRHGLGVQDGNASGQPGLTSHHRHGRQELIFSFDEPVTADSIEIGLNRFRPNGRGRSDDLALFLRPAGRDAFDLVFDDDAVTEAFSGDGRERGVVEVGELAGLDPTLAVSDFRLRATGGHFYVDGMARGQSIPGPAALALTGLAIALRPARRRAASTGVPRGG